MKVSIIIPFYNTEKYIEKCLNSIKNSSFTDYEVILINDGSIDNSLNICKKLASEDNRFRIINKENNTGISDCRNIGIKEAKCDYIIFIDSDDIIHFQMIEFLYNTIIETKSDCCICQFSSFKHNRKLKLHYLDFQIKDKSKIFNALCYSPFNKIYKKELFEDIEYPVGKNYEEKFTTYKLLLKSKSIKIIPYDLYFYRQREGSITHTCSKKNIQDMIDSYFEKINFFKNDNQYNRIYYQSLLELLKIKERFKDNSEISIIIEDALEKIRKER